MANFIASELGLDVPWHISRFFPSYKMKEIPATPLHTLQIAKMSGLEAGLNYVYLGNLGDNGNLDTICPKCGQILIERSSFGVRKNIIQHSRCPNCGMEIAGVGL